MQPHGAHDAVDEEGGAGHIPRVFQQTDKEIQDNDKGHEAHNRTDTADDAVDDKGANLFVGNDAAKPVAKHAEQRVQPFLRIGADIDNRRKHGPHQRQENRNA